MTTFEWPQEWSSYTSLAVISFSWVGNFFALSTENNFDVYVSCFSRTILLLLHEKCLETRFFSLILIGIIFSSNSFQLHAVFLYIHLYTHLLFIITACRFMFTLFFIKQTKNIVLLA